MLCLSILRRYFYADKTWEKPNASTRFEGWILLGKFQITQKLNSQDMKRVLSTVDLGLRDQIITGIFSGKRPINLKKGKTFCNGFKLSNY